MNNLRRNPALFQVNTRVMLTEMSRELGRKATLDDVPDSFLDRLAAQGFAWVYFLSVWQTGKIGQQISQNHPGWKEGFLADIPDLKDEEICGSGFAITDYKLHESFGEPDALKRLHKRVNDRGLKLMLDFVPNHTAIDHVWVDSHPEYFIEGNEDAIASAPQNYIRVGSRILAHGRDPYFDGWPDTLQLNYGNPEFIKAMRSELARISTNCDGLRCDMAMLILPDVFQRTWGIDVDLFWPDTIDAIRKAHLNFVFMAEVYWDREWELQQQGFDFTYDKRLYDRLRNSEVAEIRAHFKADLDYQLRSARFLENHDEPRAAGTFPFEQHKAAAILTFLCPGLRFMHQGQFEGYRKRVSVHISRRPHEPIDEDIQLFYEELLACLEQPVLHDGSWSLLECAAAWDGNWTSDSVIAFAWSDELNERLVAVVNYAEHQSQCYVRVPLAARAQIEVLLCGASERCSVELTNIGETGFSVDLGPWGFVVLKTS
jgi:hypothetical protein